MTKMNFTEYNQLEAYYTNRLLNITKSLNKKVTVWQDVYDNGVVVNFFCLNLHLWSIKFTMITGSQSKITHSHPKKSRFGF